MSNPFQTLGVQENASDVDIKKAYKKLAMQHHPDRGGDNKKFQEISEAYDTIKTAEKRQQYQQAKQFGGFTRQSQPFDLIYLNNLKKCLVVVNFNKDAHVEIKTCRSQCLFL